jgi:hypothetical protein
VTFAGKASFSGGVDGPASSATFRDPYGIAVDTAGVIFVSCAGDNTLRMISSGIVSTIAGGGFPMSTNGFGTNAVFNSPAHIALSTDSKIYVSEVNGNQIRLVDNAGSLLTVIPLSVSSSFRAYSGVCSAGNYARTPGSTLCDPSPAGYYKPRVAFGDNYYICGPGNYSVAGSSACLSCPSSSSYGATVCTSSPPSPEPSMQPTPYPSVNPTAEPSGFPTQQPSGNPSGTPTTSPTTSPTSNPTAAPTIFCTAGRYIKNGNCSTVPAGWHSHLQCLVAGL